MPDFDTTIANSEYVEYIVIGAHAVAWITILAAYLLDIPLAQIANLNPILLLIGLPFMYILGMMIDAVSQYVLNPIRILIKNWQLKGQDCPDEFIGLNSPTLYAAYAWRARRARIPGSAIINWLLIGISLLLKIGLTGSYVEWLIIITSLATISITAFTWAELYRRAYKFRKNACQVILDSTKASVIVKQEG